MDTPSPALMEVLKQVQTRGEELGRKLSATILSCPNGHYVVAPDHGPDLQYDPGVLEYGICPWCSAREQRPVPVR